jgi:hypothetical protein
MFKENWEKGKKHREIRKIEGQIGDLKIGLPSRKERIQKGKRDKRRKKERQRIRKPREKIDVIRKRGAKEYSDLERRKKERRGKDKFKEENIKHLHGWYGCGLKVVKN